MPTGSGPTVRAAPATSLALVVPGFYALYLAGLGLVPPASLAPSVLLVVAGLVVHVGATLGPETRDVSLDSEPSARVPQPS
jgi:hypothetical protein